MKTYTNEEKERLKDVDGTKTIGVDNEVFISFFNNNSTDPIEILMVGKTNPTKNYSVYRKEADISVIEYIVDGEGYVEINDQLVKINKGDFIYLKKGIRHSYKSSNKNPYTKVWVNFRSDILDALATKVGLVDKVISHNVEAETYMNNLFNFADKTGENQNIADYFFTTIVSLILLTRTNIEDSPMNLAMKIRSALDVSVYSEKNINDICDELHFSRQHITKIFSSKFGISPLQYLLDMKIRAAKRMLRYTNTPIKSIYRIVGFSSQSYFSSLFKTKTGLKPNEYRIKHQESIQEQQN